MSCLRRCRLLGALIAWGLLLCGAGLPRGALAQAPACGPSQLGSPCAQSGPASLATEGPPASVGNPVHLATGNKYQREVDLPALPGTLGLELVRHYNAADPRRGAFGQAWQLSYDTRLHDTGRQIAIVQPDGSRLDFVAGDSPEAPCVPPDPAHGEVRRVTGVGAERYVWAWRSGRRLAFDADGRLLHITAADGGRLVILRGRVPGTAAFGRAVRVTDPAGRTLQLTYAGDPGRVVWVGTPVGEIRYRYDAGGGLIDVAYPDGHGRTYAYDAHQRAQGRLAMTARGARRPDGSQLRLGAWGYAVDGRVSHTYAGAPGDPAALLQLRYDRTATGWRTDVLDAVGRRTQAHLQARGARHVITRLTGAPCPGCALPGTEATYSSAGALLARDAEPITRDALGRVVAVGGEPGVAVRWVDDTSLPQEMLAPSVVPGRTRTLRFAWTPVQTPNGTVRVPTSVTETGWRPGTAGQAPQALSRRWQLSWRWQASGMQLARVQADAPGVTALRSRPRSGLPPPAGWPGAQADWDDFGQVVNWRADATGQEQREHDATGRLVARVFANGQRWQYGYDAQGRLVEMDLGGETVRLGWKDDLPVSVSHPQEAETRRYDAQGRLLERRVRRPAEGPARVTYAESFVRDPEGRVVAHHLPEGGVLHYRWGQGRRLLALAWEDATGRLHALVRTPPVGGGYDLGNGVQVRPLFQAEEMTGVQHARGEQTVLGHVARLDAGRVTAETVVTGALASAMVYRHDEAGRLRGEAQAAGGKARVARRHDWAEDGSALARADGPIVRDASGLPRQVAGRTLHYGPLRRLAAVDDAAGARLVTYRHNAHGEQVRREPRAGVAEDLLYVNQRLAAIWRDGGVVRRYVYANDAPVAMIDYAVPQPVSSTPVPRLAQWLAGSWRLAPAPPGQVRYLHADAIGLVRAVTDAQGARLWQGEFDAFGALRASQGMLDPGLRLPGQSYDPATGWHDNYLRTYDPEAGHYLEPDPLGPAPWLASVPGVVARTSAYGYAAQQPRRHADPLGLVLFAFEGTFSVIREPTNVVQFGLLYGADARHPDAKSYLVTAPGDASDSPWIDAGTGGTGAQILQEQWDRLIAHLSELGTGGPGEAIDLVGYSRGAALARHFANDIVAQVRQGRFWQWVAGVGAVTACVDLRFMGLFDTVAQFGALGSRDPDYDFTIAPDWSLVAHAVSLHEQRLIMGLTLVANADGSLPANAVEMPFVGSHGDIGGGFGDGTGNYRDLSDIPLAWMLARAREAGVPMREAPPTLQIVSDPTLNDKRSLVERVSEQWRAEIAAGLGLTDIVPPSLVLDRPVRAADSTVLADSAADHPFIGPARAETEAFIHRFPNWRTSGKEEVGIVDLEAYAKWLAARGVDGTWRPGAPPD